MKTSIRYAQLETGLSKPYYTYNYYKAYFLATPTWYTNIWQYCSESHIKLQEADPWVYSPPRDNDFYLMDVVLRSSIIQEQMDIFNRVRLNLTLLKASDIVMVDKSKKMSQDIINGNNLQESTLNWMNKAAAPASWMDIFNMVVKQVKPPHLCQVPIFLIA